MAVPELLALRRRERDALVRRATTLLKRDQRVVAAWLTGSLGRGDADDLSDIDLWVVVREEAMRAIAAARREFVRGLGAPLLIEEAPQNAPSGGAYLLVLYAGENGPHQVDWYWQPCSGAVVPVSARVLFDRAGVAGAAAPVPTQRERADAAAQQTAFFWAMANNAAKNIARGHFWAAISMLSAVDRILQNFRMALSSPGGEPVYKDTRTTPPAWQPLDQLIELRRLATEMESLIPRVVELGAEVPTGAVQEIYRFFDLVEAILEEKRN
jgi:predicted nucleotidyltransferase